MGIGSYVGVRNYIVGNKELNKIIQQNKNKDISLLAHETKK